MTQSNTHSQFEQAKAKKEAIIALLLDAEGAVLSLRQELHEINKVIKETCTHENKVPAGFIYDWRCPDCGRVW